jgi:hypothetical protein
MIIDSGPADISVMGCSAKILLRGELKKEKKDESR